MDEIMRCLQGAAQEVAVGSLSSLCMRLGMALSENKEKNEGSAGGTDCALSTSIDWTLPGAEKNDG